MNKIFKDTYNSKGIIAAIFIWEFIFWIGFSIVLWMMDFYSNSSDRMVFKEESYFTYFLLLVPIITSFIWFLTWRRKRHELLGSKRILAMLIHPTSNRTLFIRYFFLRNALAFLIIALAQPVYGKQKVSATLETLELVLAIDVSNSMNTKDIDPEISRLEIIKRAMIQLVNNLHGEKIGISIFAGGSYIQLPLTADYEAAKMYIHEIQTDMVSNQGTDVASALDLSVKMFTKAKTSKAILLVSDGENHEGDIAEPIRLLKENKINLAVLGIGTASGGLIPNNPERPEMGYKTDANGRTIVSKMNAKFIENTAKAAGGIALITSSPFPNLDEIITNLKHMKRTKVEGVELDVTKNWYQIPLVIAFLFFIAFILPIKPQFD